MNTLFLTSCCLAAQTLAYNYNNPGYNYNQDFNYNNQPYNYNNQPYSYNNQWYQNNPAYGYNNRRVFHTETTINHGVSGQVPQYNPYHMPTHGYNHGYPGSNYGGHNNQGYSSNGHGIVIKGPSTVPVTIVGPSGKIYAEGLYGVD